MLNEILPEKIKDVIRSRLNPSKIYEIRFRNAMPISINYGGNYFFVGNTGIVNDAHDALYSSAAEIEQIVTRATEFSLYSVNNQLKNGYVTINGGIRIGICGEIVKDDDKIKTIKDFTSINIRIPHEIRGCSLTALTFIDEKKPRNTLIVAPPGAGKTTVLRDLCFNLSSVDRNILLVDERCEIAAVSNRQQQLNVGKSVDIISNCPKSYAFSCGIRNMRPDLIITDELASEEDALMAIRVAASGIKIIASAHAANADELKKRKEFAALIESKLFTRYIFLSNKNGPGTYESIYDADFRCIYFGVS